MLHINLFHEIQRLEFERKYDPVRIMGLAFVLGLLGLGVWTAILYLNYKPAREAVDSLQKQIKTMEPQHKEAEMRLAELPAYQKEFVFLKKRAQEKSLQSRNLEVFKGCMPTNLFVKKLSIFREVISEKLPGPKDKKGHPTFITRSTSVNLMDFEATYSEPTKPKSLEQRDHLVEFFAHSENLGGIAAETTKDGKVVNTVKLAGFSTTEPVGNELAVGTIDIRVELKK